MLSNCFKQISHQDVVECIIFKSEKLNPPFSNLLLVPWVQRLTPSTSTTRMPINLNMNNVSQEAQVTTVLQIRSEKHWRSSRLKYLLKVAYI